MWHQRYIEFRLGQVSEEMDEDAPQLELSPDEHSMNHEIVAFEMWILNIMVAEYVRHCWMGQLTYAFLPSSEVSEMHVDNSEKWHIELTANTNDTVHLLYTTHEIGHALGLHHSPQKNSIIDQLCDEDERRRCSEYGCRRYGRRSTEKNGARDREDSGLYT
ncbi:hypothetical protein P5V15_007174 [Pogonomyrmex californicus]